MILLMLYRIPFNDDYDFSWFHLLGLPLAYGFIKYGWRWVRNIIDITEDDYLLKDEVYYQKAIKQAQLSLNTFLNYVVQGQRECFAKFPIEISEGEVQSVWGVVHYFDRERHELNVSIITDLYEEELEEGRKFIAPDKLEDWQVVKEKGILGFFTYRARIQKAKNEGFRLSRKSRKIADSILT